MPLRPALRVETLDDRTVPAAIDLTGHGAIGSAGGTFFTQYDARLSDPSHLRTFAQLDGPLLRASTVQGYNTDARPTQFNANASPGLTRSLSRNDIPAVTVGGVVYREFVLDAGQLNLLQPRVSLDQLRLYVGTAGNLHGYNAADKTLGGLAPVYDLDAGGDTWVVLDLGLTAAVGGADMRIYVPDAVLAGGDFVYLYSKFGEHLAPVGAAEKWSTFVGQSPAPPAFTPPSPPPPPPAGAGIAGMVYGDANGNCQPEDDEVGLANRVVYLDADGDGQLGAGEASRTTDAEGRYSFAGLASGTTYTVRVVTGSGEFALSSNVTPGDGQTFTLDIGLSAGSQT